MERPNFDIKQRPGPLIWDVLKILACVGVITTIYLSYKYDQALNSKKSQKDSKEDNF